VSFYVSNEQIIVACFPPYRGLSQQFLFEFFAAYFAMALLILNGLMIRSAYPPIAAGCSSMVSFVCGIYGQGTTIGIGFYK
jgi:hypothetical protein